MTTAQQVDAVRQLRSHCEMQIELKNWQPISVRGSLYKLGFTELETNEVIGFLVLGGFTYCIDPIIPITNPDGKQENPAYSVCYWSPDQLLSRLPHRI